MVVKEQENKDQAKMDQEGKKVETGWRHTANRTDL
jgi:hypothetical protein